MSYNEFRSKTLEEKDAATNHVLAGYRGIIEGLKEIKPTIKQFDGSVYNCRFDKAIEHRGTNVDTLIYVSSYTYSSTKTIHVSSNKGLHNYNSRDIRIILTEPESGKRPRINAAAILKEIDETIENIQTEISNIIKARNNLDKYNELIQQAEELVKNAYDCLYGQGDRYGYGIFSHIYGTSHHLESR